MSLLVPCEIGSVTKPHVPRFLCVLQAIDGALAQASLASHKPVNKMQEANLLLKTKGLKDMMPKESLKEKVARQQAMEDQGAGQSAECDDH